MKHKKEECNPPKIGFFRKLPEDFWTCECGRVWSLTVNFDNNEPSQFWAAKD